MNLKLSLSEQLPGCEIRERQDAGIILCKWNRICSAIIQSSDGRYIVDVSHWRSDASILEPVAVQRCDSMEHASRRLVELTIAFERTRKELDNEAVISSPLSFGWFQLDDEIAGAARLPNFIDLCQISVRASLSVCSRAVARVAHFSGAIKNMRIRRSIENAFCFANGDSSACAVADEVWQAFSKSGSAAYVANDEADVNPTEELAAGLCLAMQWACDFLACARREVLFSYIGLCTDILRGATNLRMPQDYRETQLMSAAAIDFLALYSLGPDSAGLIGAPVDASNYGPLREILKAGGSG